MSENDDTPLLEDLNVRTIRAKNDGVDEKITELEEEAADLREEVAEKDQRIESLTEEKETATELLRQFRDDQKSDHLERIKQANAVVAEDDEVDLSALEEADVGVLEAVADQVEQLAEAASQSQGVSNTQSTPDLGSVDPNDVDDSPEDEMAAVAEDLGMASAYEKLQNDDFDGPQRVGGSDDTNEAAQALASALDEIGGGA